MKLKILMIDDHPSMIEGYKIILSYNDFGYEIETTSATDTKSAYEIITKTKKSNAFNVVFLDYSLPPYDAKNIQNGKDLAIIIKKRMPKAKIVILTSHTESILLYDIIRNVEPAGVLVKSDFSAEELLSAGGRSAHCGVPPRRRQAHSPDVGERPSPREQFLRQRGCGG